MMSHDELRELIPAYALAALDDDERLALETHLRECDDCRALLAEYRVLSDDLLYAAPPVAAPAGLTEDMRQRIAAPATGNASRFSLRALLRRPAFGLALAGLAALLLIGSNAYWAARTARSERQVAAMAALAKAPGVILTASEEGYGRGVLFRPADGEVSLLCVWGMPSLPQGQAYQVWLISGQERASGGTFRVTDEGYGVLFIKPPDSLQDYDGLGITVEPAGGSPGPTTPRVMGGQL